MAHKVMVHQAPRDIGKQDLEIKVSTITDGSPAKLGTLLISQGNLEWMPKGASVNKKRLTWVKFAELMEGGENPIKSVKAQKTVRGKTK